MTLDPGSGMEKIQIEHWVEGTITFPIHIFSSIFTAFFLYIFFYLFQAFVSVIPRRKGAEEKEDSDT